jgi:hypothetical protein
LPVSSGTIWRDAAGLCLFTENWELKTFA